MAYIHVQINGQCLLWKILICSQEVGEMRKKLIYNYWLILSAWCLFLNDLTLVAIVLCLGGCALLVSIKRRINYWRLCFLSVTLYVTIAVFLSFSSVSYFFPKLYIVFAFISLDLALTFERMYFIKNKYLLPFLIEVIFGMIVLSVVAVLLPASNYSIFTKNNLFVMIYLIFLPCMAPILGCLAYKNIKSRTKKFILHKKEASVY